MPLKKGHSQEVISQNIKEMVAAGHDPKQAVAASLAHARKYRKMAEGGMVDFDDDLDEGTNNTEDAQRSLGELQAQGRSMPQDVENPEMEEHDDHLAKALYDKSQSTDALMFAEGGLVEGMADTDVGNMPDEDMADSTEEPMSSEMMSPMGLSMDAQMALMERKKKRRYAS